LRHLRYFVAVAEELNYRKASERLRVAQPALSSQIKDLEEELGVRLLDRDTGGVRLTDAGAAFLDATRLTLAQAQQAGVVAREAAKGRRGRLNIGYSGPLLMGFMPESLKTYHEQYPDVELSLVDMAIGDQIAALESGSIHIGFTIGTDSPLPASLQYVEVLRSSIQVVMGHGHHLAKVSRVGLADLVNENLLCISNKKGSVPHGAIMQRRFDVRGLKVKPIKPIDGAEAFRATLESGLGISLIPQIGSLKRDTALVFKPLKDTGPDLIMELRAVWAKEQNSQLAENFIELLRKVKSRGKQAEKAK
jgi:DNA-binding transcriptional LysR family regulator